MWMYFILILLLLLTIHFLLNYNYRARLLRRIPGPRGYFIVGNALDVILSPAELFALTRKNATQWPNLNRFWSFGIGALNIYGPDEIEAIISSTQHITKSPVYNFLSDWLRDGLLLSTGTKWQKRRKILTPAFHFNILKQFCVILEENSQRFTENLKDTEGKSINVVPAISEYTLHSICETAMRTQLGSETSEAGRSYKNAICELGNQFVHRLARLPLHNNFIYNLYTLGKQNKHLNIVHSFTKKVIKDRRQYIRGNGGNNFDDEKDTQADEHSIYFNKKKTAMLDLLLKAERDGLIDEIGVQEEIDTFMFEGHDTTATGLTYCIMLIANHKSIQDKIIEELDEIFGESTRAADIEDLSKMRYLERCIKESLRLYPPVPSMGRILSEEINLNGYTVPAGTYCHIQIFDLHRREDLFKDPLVFDPDRFLPHNTEGRHPYAYIPFSAGPRNCIGQKFAILEMKSLLSAVLRRYNLYPITKPEDLKFVLDLVLRTTEPVHVRFVKRNKV